MFHSGARAVSSPRPSLPSSRRVWNRREMAERSVSQACGAYHPVVILVSGWTYVGGVQKIVGALQTDQRHQRGIGDVA